MTNKEIYKKTLCFSIRRLVFDIISLLVLAGLAVGGFIIAENKFNKGPIGLVIGLVVGIVILALLTRLVSYIFKAGQIAMMTRGITEGSLPDNVYKEGKRAVKERFATIAGFFAVTAAIKGIFTQIGRGITSAGRAIGGDSGGAVGSAISTAINTLVAYLCDCCLGWVFYRKEKGSVRATCEGAVLFFKHGKTLAKNMGRIFGMSLVSLLAIGGVFFGIFYLIFSSFPRAFETLAAEFVVAEGAEVESRWLYDILSNPKTLVIAVAVVAGIAIWSVIHSAFIRPFILTGVLRNYLQSGMEEVPTEEAFASLERISPKFAKLSKQLD
ncbi:MAG: hypothetical protein J5950_07135 [Clostridia bacterium]|nr:hypothetical protein [Clostridia bacterium]